MVLQVDLSDCDELGDAIFRCLSDGRPGYAVDGGSPSLRYLSFLFLRIPQSLGRYCVPTIPYCNVLHRIVLCRDSVHSATPQPLL